MGTDLRPSDATERSRRLRQRIAAATADLGTAGVATPEADATILAEFALGISRLNPLDPPQLDAAFEQHYQELIERRRRREPVQLITGSTTFRYLELTVAPGVFIPRPETEWVTEQAIRMLRQEPASGAEHPVVLDMCGGTGAIGLAIAQEVPGARVSLVEVDPVAVAAIEANARRNRLSVTVLCGDVGDPTLLGASEAAADVVISNPPYIPPDGVPIDAEVRDYDPAAALYGGGQDGLQVPRSVVRAAARVLRPGGGFVMEHGADQGEEVRAIVADHGGFTAIETCTDLTGRDRMVLAVRSNADANHRG